MRFCVHIVFVTNVASKNVNEKIKTQTFSPPFVEGYIAVVPMAFFLFLKRGGIGVEQKGYDQVVK